MANALHRRQLAGVVMKVKLGPAAAVAHHFYVRPLHIADAGAQRLSHGLLDGKTTGEAGRPAGAMGLLLHRKKSVVEAGAVPGSRSFYARYFYEVYTGNDHGSVVGYWLLVIGYWLLVIGVRLITNNQ
jgi:hypothetical protein